MADRIIRYEYDWWLLGKSAYRIVLVESETQKALLTPSCRKVYCTVHQRIVHPRLNFELFCDWLKTGHVVRLLVYDWIIPPPILFAEGQLLFGALKVKLNVFTSM
jgi:hypothetical protein